jgi:hypothetical protein
MNKMINWLKSALNKLAEDDKHVDYIIAEYHANKKNRAKKIQASEYDIDDESRFSDTMQIDNLHQRN